jgi:hypothetical protein
MSIGLPVITRGASLIKGVGNMCPYSYLRTASPPPAISSIQPSQRPMMIAGIMDFAPFLTRRILDARRREIGIRLFILTLSYTPINKPLKGASNSRALIYIEYRKHILLYFSEK